MPRPAPPPRPPTPKPKPRRPRAPPSTRPARANRPPPSGRSTRSARADQPPPRDPRLERGTVEHYLDPELYDHEYRRRRADINYYRALLGGRLGPLPRGPLRILELGVGTGRLLLPLLRDGHRVTGVDLSAPMLARCVERLERLPAAARARAALVRGDFRALDLGRRFNVVLTPFNAMMHLYTHDDIARFLAVVRRHLAPGGLFAFDVVNPDLEWLVRDPTRRWARTRFKDPRDGKTYYYSTNHVYDRATQINWIRLYYDEAGPGVGDLTPAGRRPGGDLTAAGAPAGPGLPSVVRSRVVQLAQRQFFPEELALVLSHHGFRLDAREGGFVGEPFEGESWSQVCRCSIRRSPRR